MTALYRHYGSDGTLLYVGVSLNAATRLVQHRGSARWFPDITRMEVQHFDSREAALRAEAEAIAKERPKFNNGGSKKESEDPRKIPQWLAEQDCTFASRKGGSGHLTVRRGERTSQLPMHSSHKEFGTGLVNKILKDLGLK